MPPDPVTALVETHRAAIQTLVFRYLADNRHLEPTVNDIMDQMTAAVREALERADAHPLVQQAVEEKV